MKETQSLAALLTSVTRGTSSSRWSTSPSSPQMGWSHPRWSTRSTRVRPHTEVSRLPPVEHAGHLGLISATIDSDGFAKFFIHAAALDLLGLDIEAVHEVKRQSYRCWRASRRYQRDAAGNKGRARRAAASPCCSWKPRSDLNKSLAAERAVATNGA